jgi:hypothetical protein
MRQFISYMVFRALHHANAKCIEGGIPTTDRTLQSLERLLVAMGPKYRSRLQDEMRLL